MDTDSDSIDTPERGGHGAGGHVPVLLKEAIDFLAVKRGGTYLDATVGLGGHSYEIARRLGAPGHLIGFDKDPAALERVLARFCSTLEDSGGTPAATPQITLIHGSFAEVGERSCSRIPRRHPGGPGRQQFAARAIRRADLVFRRKDRWTCG